jgi:hypothetical protein
MVLISTLSSNPSKPRERHKKAQAIRTRIVYALRVLTVVMKREDVAGCEEETQPAEGRSIREDTGNNIEDNSTEVDEELSAH